MTIDMMIRKTGAKVDNVSLMLAENIAHSKRTMTAVVLLVKHSVHLVSFKVSRGMDVKSTVTDILELAVLLSRRYKKTNLTALLMLVESIVHSVKITIAAVLLVVHGVHLVSLKVSRRMDVKSTVIDTSVLAVLQFQDTMTNKKKRKRSIDHQV